MIKNINLLCITINYLLVYRKKKYKKYSYKNKNKLLHLFNYSTKQN